MFLNSILRSSFLFLSSTGLAYVNSLHFQTICFQSMQLLLLWVTEALAYPNDLCVFKGSGRSASPWFQCCRMMQSDENETHAECEMGLCIELKLGFFLLQSLTLPRPDVADNLLQLVFAHLCCMFVSIISSRTTILWFSAWNGVILQYL